MDYAVIDERSLSHGPPTLPYPVEMMRGRNGGRNILFARSCQGSVFSAPRRPNFDDRTVNRVCSTPAPIPAMIVIMGFHRHKGPLSELWKTLLRPDHDDEEMRDRQVVITAANQLQVGEFQLMQLAYREWHGKDLPEALMSRLFTDYMLRDEVPHWARHYARTIIEGLERGEIDENDPHYHRYDHEYTTTVPHGLRRFCIAVGCLILFLGGGIILAEFATGTGATMFPPYLDTTDLPKTK